MLPWGIPADVVSSVQVQQGGLFVHKPIELVILCFHCFVALCQSLR